MHLLEEITSRRRSSKPGDALALFPQDWTDRSDSSEKAEYALEYALCQYQLQEYGKAFEYIAMAYSLRHYVTSPERHLDIIVAQAWLMQEYGSYDQIPDLARSTYDAYKASAEKRSALSTEAGGYLLWHWGWAEHKLGDYAQSVRLLGVAVDVLNKTAPSEAWCVILDSAEVHLENGQPAEARRLLKPIPQDALGTRLKSVWHRHMATVCLAEGHLEEASNLAAQALAFAEKKPHWREKAHAALVQVQVQEAKNQLTADDRDRIITLCRRVGDDALVRAAYRLKV